MNPHFSANTYKAQQKDQKQKEMPPKPKNYVYTFQREALRDSPLREDEQSLNHTALKPK